MKLPSEALPWLRALRAEECAYEEIMKEELPSYRDVAGAQSAKRITTLKLAIFDKIREELDKDNP